MKLYKKKHFLIADTPLRAVKEEGEGIKSIFQLYLSIKNPLTWMLFQVKRKEFMRFSKANMISISRPCLKIFKKIQEEICLLVSQDAIARISGIL